MSRTLRSKPVGFGSRTSRRVPRRPVVERLEARELLATLTAIPLGFSPTEGQAFSGQVATVVDSDTTVTPGNFAVAIDWGDGTPLDTTTGGVFPATAQSTGTVTLLVSGTHTYAEEAGSVVPPAAFNVTVTVTDTKNVVVGHAISQAGVADAGLAVGNPVVANPPALFSGAGTANAAAALAAFKAAVGGANNADTPPQASGFRAINWDGVKLDGTDFGGGANTTVISAGKTVGIPLDRFQSRGVYFGAVYAVSGDRFASVNPAAGAANLFPPFSPQNTFAMFNDNGIDFHFVAPSPGNTAIVNAASRGFGAIFTNVEIANTTTIQYFNGETLLETVSAPVGGRGQSVFVGALFNAPLVTRVVLTLGTDVIFNFDGTTVTPGPAADDGVTHNLVTTDDWAYAEPVAIPTGDRIVSGPQGASPVALVTTSARTPFTGRVATFHDLDPNGNARDYTATINWGDGHLTNGTIVSNGQGGFDVIGTNTYAQAGTFALNTDIMDFGGAPAFAVNGTARIVPKAVPGDYDGDGKTDLGIFDATTSTTIVVPSGGAPPILQQIGDPTHRNLPVSGDYFGTGRVDLGIFDATTSTLIVLPPVGSPGLRPIMQQFGDPGHNNIPVTGDYYGTGQADPGIFDATTSTLIVAPPAGSTGLQPIIMQFGDPTHRNLPVSGDYFGTGRTDLGIFDATTSTLIVVPPAGSGLHPIMQQFGDPRHHNIPVVGDYDGDGKADLGIYDATTSTLIVVPSGGGHPLIQPFGDPTHRNAPLPATPGVGVLGVSALDAQVIPDVPAVAPAPKARSKASASTATATV